MALQRLICLTVGAIAFVVASLPTYVEARPNPDESGVCYFFQGDTQELTQPCVISTGYGAGAHYAILTWNDGVRTEIYMINNCPDGNYDADGFCDYTVDDYEAVPYYRDVFMNVTTTPDEESLNCFRVTTTGNSVCYR